MGHDIGQAKKPIQLSPFEAFTMDMFPSFFDLIDLEWEEVQEEYLEAAQCGQNQLEMSRQNCFKKVMGRIIGGMNACYGDPAEQAVNVPELIQEFAVDFVDGSNVAELVVNIGGIAVTIASWYIDYDTQNCLQVWEAHATEGGAQCDYLVAKMQAACNGELQ
jgi:hypothetical protein